MLVERGGGGKKRVDGREGRHRSSSRGGRSKGRRGREREGTRALVEEGKEGDWRRRGKEASGAGWSERGDGMRETGGIRVCVAHDIVCLMTI